MRSQYSSYEPHPQEMNRSNEFNDTPKKVLASQSMTMATPATQETTHRYKVEKSFGQTEKRPHEWNKLEKDIGYLKYEVLLATERKLPVFDYDLPLIGNVLERKAQTRSNRIQSTTKSGLKKSLTKQKTNSLSKTKRSEFRSTDKSNLRKQPEKLDKEGSGDKGIMKAKTLRQTKGSVNKDKKVNKLRKGGKDNSKKNSISSFKEELDKKKELEGNDEVKREFGVKSLRADPSSQGNETLHKEYIDQHKNYNVPKDNLQSTYEKESLKKPQTYTEQEKKDLRIEELDKDYAPKGEFIPRTGYNKGYERRMPEDRIYEDTKGSTRDYTKNFGRSPLIDYKTQASIYNDEFRTAPIDIYEKRGYGRQSSEYDRGPSVFQGSEFMRRTPRVGEYNYERISGSYAPYQGNYPTAKEYERLYDSYLQRSLERKAYYGTEDPNYEIDSPITDKYGKKYREQLPRSGYEATSPETYHREYSGIQPRSSLERSYPESYEVRRSEPPKYLSQRPMDYERRDLGRSYGLRSEYGERVPGIGEYRGIPRDNYRGDLLDTKEPARLYEALPRDEYEGVNSYKGRLPRAGDYGDGGGIRNEYGRLVTPESNEYIGPKVEYSKEEQERTYGVGRDYPRSEEFDRPIRSQYAIHESKPEDHLREYGKRYKEPYELEYSKGRSYTDHNERVPDTIDEAEELFKDYERGKPSREYGRSKSINKKNTDEALDEDVVNERRGRTPKRASLRASIERLTSPHCRVTESNWLRETPGFKELEGRVGTEQALLLAKEYDAHCWKCFGKDQLLAPYKCKSKNKAITK